MGTVVLMCVCVCVCNRCDLEEPLSVYEACINSTDVADISGGVANITAGVANITGGVANMTMPVIGSEDILAELGVIGLPWYWDMLVVMVFGLLLRIGAYLCLRFLHTKR